MPHPLDGSLRDWADVSRERRWKVLLLGNGLSINVSPRFNYGSLFEFARDAGLTEADRALFAQTENFERVLADLATAIRVSDVFGTDARAASQAYPRIQLALGEAVRHVHPTRIQVPNTCLEAIRTELLRYEWIFTTSYDLIVYWAMGRGPNETFRPFMDHFRYGNVYAFDPERADVLRGSCARARAGGRRARPGGGSGRAAGRARSSPAASRASARSPIWGSA